MIEPRPCCSQSGSPSSCSAPSAAWEAGLRVAPAANRRATRPRVSRSVLQTACSSRNLPERTILERTGNSRRHPKRPQSIFRRCRRGRSRARTAVQRRAIRRGSARMACTTAAAAIAFSSATATAAGSTSLALPPDPIAALRATAVQRRFPSSGAVRTNRAAADTNAFAARKDLVAGPSDAARRAVRNHHPGQRPQQHLHDAKRAIRCRACSCFAPGKSSPSVTTVAGPFSQSVASCFRSAMARTSSKTTAAAFGLATGSASRNSQRSSV